MTEEELENIDRILLMPWVNWEDGDKRLVAYFVFEELYSEVLVTLTSGVRLPFSNAPYRLSAADAEDAFEDSVTKLLDRRSSGDKQPFKWNPYMSTATDAIGRRENFNKYFRTFVFQTGLTKNNKNEKEGARYISGDEPIRKGGGDEPTTTTRFEGISALDESASFMTFLGENFPRLTPQEKQVLQMRASVESFSEIAKVRSLSHTDVKQIWYSATRKLFPGWDDKKRTTYWLKVVEDYAFKDISEELEEEENTTRARFRRFVDKFSTSLGLPKKKKKRKKKRKK